MCDVSPGLRDWGGRGRDTRGIGFAKVNYHWSFTPNKRGSMTKGQWLLLGAVAIGIAVGVYIVFFCPTECH
jgi:hypothetical protein